MMGGEYVALAAPMRPLTEPVDVPVACAGGAFDPAGVPVGYAGETSVPTGVPVG